MRKRLKEKLGKTLGEKAEKQRENWKRKSLRFLRMPELLEKVRTVQGTTPSNRRNLTNIERSLRGGQGN